MNEEIIGYHGTKKEYEQDIIQQGFKESKAKQGHWLGRGIYFYGNIYYAVEWGIINFTDMGNSYKDYIEKCSILEAVLDIKNFNLLDLNDPVGFEYYLQILDNIEERFPNKIDKIKNNGDVEIFRLLEELEDETGEQYISMFDILTADYPKDIYNKKDKKRRGDFLPCIQKQICVKNNEAIKRVETINIEQEPISFYFNIIIKNRKENKHDKQSRNFKKIVRKSKKYTK